MHKCIEVCKRFKDNKAPRPDGIPNRLLKLAVEKGISKNVTIKKYFPVPGKHNISFCYQKGKVNTENMQPICLCVMYFTFADDPSAESSYQQSSRFLAVDFQDVRVSNGGFGPMIPNDVGSDLIAYTWSYLRSPSSSSFSVFEKLKLYLMLFYRQRLCRLRSPF
uniref:Uncharacterized protein n=1 Tax=Megaselia scalaris TaxID=36166 RepID=T1GUN4_MEGSC